MRIWHDQLLHTKRSFGVVLYSQVQIAEFHPGLKVCHKSKYANFTYFTLTLQRIINISKQTFISNYIYRKKIVNSDFLCLHNHIHCCKFCEKYPYMYLMLYLSPSWCICMYSKFYFYILSVSLYIPVNWYSIKWIKHSFAEFTYCLRYLFNSSMASKVLFWALSIATFLFLANCR